MYCAICHENKDQDVKLLGIRVCKTCFEDISMINVSNEKYDYYKEIIKLVLKNYIYERANLNPVN